MTDRTTTTEPRLFSKVEMNRAFHCTRWHVDILSCLEEGCGWGAGHIGAMVWPSFSPRQRSQAATQHCKELERRGLVRRLDDNRPIAWVLTKAGAEWLS